MRYWVGVTDKGWFESLRLRNPVEVNFWQPSGKPPAKFFLPGTPFLFKLHSPNNFIVGGGYYLRFSALPIELAWEAFGTNNGLDTRQQFYARVQKYRGASGPGAIVGCSILVEPFFWAESKWIPVPKSWAPNIVQGKSFDTAEAEGAALWAQVQLRLAPKIVANEAREPSARYGADFLAHARLGQGAFRILVTEAYERRCAITGERTLPVLQAAHIVPYAAKGEHAIENGMLLRSDWHTLFDKGYVTVTDEYRIEVSKRIREEFSNGRDYYRMHGEKLASLPGSIEELPSKKALQWHNEEVYLG